MALLKFEPFQNVGASQRAILDSQVVLGNTLKKIVLQLGGTFTKAMITLIKVKLNQKTVMEVTGSQLDSINKYLGIADDAAFLTIPFDDITAALPGQVGEDIGALDTSLGVNSFRIEVDIGGATSPTLAAWFEAVPPLPRSGELAATSPALRSLITSTLTPNTAAEHTLRADIGQNAGALLARMYIFHSNLTSFELKKNNVPIFEEVTVAVNEFVQGEHGRVPQSGLYVYDPVASGDMTKMIRTAGAVFQQLYTVSGSDTITVVSDIRAGLNQL